MAGLQNLRCPLGFPAGTLQRLAALGRGLPGLGPLDPEGFLLGPPREKAPSPVDRAAGHSAAGPENLPLQGDHGKPVVPGLSQLYPMVQMVHHHGPPQQGVHRRSEDLLTGDQFRCHRQISRLPLKALLSQDSGPEGGQR